MALSAIAHRSMTSGVRVSPADRMMLSQVSAIIGAGAALSSTER